MNVAYDCVRLVLIIIYYQMTFPIINYINVTPTFRHRAIELKYLPKIYFFRKPQNRSEKNL